MPLNHPETIFPPLLVCGKTLPGAKRLGTAGFILIFSKISLYMYININSYPFRYFFGCTLFLDFEDTEEQIYMFLNMLYDNFSY